MTDGGKVATVWIRLRTFELFHINNTHTHIFKFWVCFVILLNGRTSDNKKSHRYCYLYVLEALW